MIEIGYKKKRIEVKVWDELPKNAFIEVFKLIGSEIAPVAERAYLSDFLAEFPLSKKFVVDSLPTSFFKPSLYGPRDNFADMTMGEFMFADSYYAAYSLKPTQENLKKFIVTLYRKKANRKFGRINRIKFDEKRVAYDADRLKIEEHVANAILFNYSAFHKYIEHKYKFVFDGEASEQPSIPRWDKVIRSLAEGKSDDDFQKIADTLMHNVLSQANDLFKTQKMGVD